MAAEKLAAGDMDSDGSRSIYDERLIATALSQAAVTVGVEELELDRVDPLGPWRTRRVAHTAAREVGKIAGMDLLERSIFIAGVKRAASDLRVVDAIRAAQGEVAEAVEVQ